MKFPGKLEAYRVRSGEYASRTGDDYGAFIVPGPCGRELLVEIPLPPAIAVGVVGANDEARPA